MFYKGQLIRDSLGKKDTKQVIRDASLEIHRANMNGVPYKTY